MTGIDLTPANAAARDAIWRHATRDVTGSIDRPTADRLAARAVRAATPHIAAAVREQVSAEILARRAGVDNTRARVLEMAAFVARGGDA